MHLDIQSISKQVRESFMQVKQDSLCMMLYPQEHKYCNLSKCLFMCMYVSQQKTFMILQEIALASKSEIKRQHYAIIQCIFIVKTHSYKEFLTKLIIIPKRVELQTHPLEQNSKVSLKMSEVEIFCFVQCRSHTDDGKKRTGLPQKRKGRGCCKLSHYTHYTRHFYNNGTWGACLCTQTSLRNQLVSFIIISVGTSQ